MRHFMLLGLLFGLTPMIGCDGGKGGGLATDSGKMTVQEYEEMQKAEQAQLNETMEQPASGN